MTGPAFTPGQRLWHSNRGWCTYLLLSWNGDSEVLFDKDGDAARITTESLHLTDRDGAGPPPVPAVAVARFEEFGLTPTG